MPEEFLTSEQVEKIYKGIDPTNGSSIKLIESSVSEVENTYQKGIVSNPKRRQYPKQMVEWSILSDHVKCVQHDKFDTLPPLEF